MTRPRTRRVQRARLGGAVTVGLGAVLFISAVSAQVTLRDGIVIDRLVGGVSPAGVKVQTDPPSVLTWDRVFEVRGPKSAAAEDFAEMADALWRARTRLTRGDVRLAGPIFEDWSLRDGGPTGATRCVVMEGLLACRLARLAQVSSVGAWLEALRLRREAPGSVELGFTSAIDSATGLAPGAPPIWLAGPAVEAFAVTPIAPTGDAVVDALASLYREAAARETGAPWSDRAAVDAVANDETVRFVRAIVDSASTLPAVREQARAAMRSGLSRDAGTWREAWRRVALGRSLLLEPDRATRDLGLVHLLHLPARFMHDQPYLAGVALALASEELARRGDQAGARRLLDDLEGLPASHPARAWLDAAGRRGAIDRGSRPSATNTASRADKGES